AYPAPTAVASAAYGIVPAHPPLPTAWKVPFHPVSGSQISTLISESLVGVSVAVTRQNSGSLAYIGGTAAPAGLGPGGTTAPSGTCSAAVIVVCASASLASVSQGAALAEADTESVNSPTRAKTDRRMA